MYIYHVIYIYIPMAQQYIHICMRDQDSLDSASSAENLAAKEAAPAPAKVALNCNNFTIHECGTYI